MLGSVVLLEALSTHWILVLLLFLNGRARKVEVLNKVVVVVVIVVVLGNEV